MKNKIGTILLICSMWGSVVWGQSYRFPFQNPQLNEEARLDNLISLLTLDEKVALFGGAAFHGWVFVELAVRELFMG